MKIKDELIEKLKKAEINTIESYGKVEWDGSFKILLTGNELELIIAALEKQVEEQESKVVMTAKEILLKIKGLRTQYDLFGKGRSTAYLITPKEALQAMNEYAKQFKTK